MGFILFIIATLLWLPLTVINWLIVFYKHGISSNYFLELATDIDRFGNRTFRSLFNLMLITNEGHQFGDFRETISSALGKNERDKTLSKFGKCICAILDFIDKNHCQKSINKTF